MDAILARLDPVTAVLVLAIGVLYMDSRMDRQRYQKSIEGITALYQESLRHTSEALLAVKAEMSILTQTLIGSLRRGDDDRHRGDDDRRG